MKFGVREVANMILRAKARTKIGNTVFEKGQPVLYIDTAKTATLEQASATVYATGGRGNTRLIAWEGEKTLTFTVEDALLSPIGLAVLSGAGLIKGGDSDGKKVHIHTTARAQVETEGIDLTDALGATDEICDTAPIFVIVTEEDGSLTGELIKDLKVEAGGKKLVASSGDLAASAGKIVMVDFYVTKNAASVSELQISASNFAGYYYVEADTLFRRQSDGVDMPANITLPNVKIQSNLTFTMASSGDPGTFTFTMDAFPGYTYFDSTKQVLCVIQVVEDATAAEETYTTVMGHEDEEDFEDVTGVDSVPAAE